MDKTPEERIAVALERIADSLESQPSLQETVSATVAAIFSTDLTGATVRDIAELAMRPQPKPTVTIRKD